jgi:two-component system, response regulator PdtaR
MLFSKRKQIVKRILIVEDEPLVAFDNETMVVDAGYQVVGTVDSHLDAVGRLDDELAAAQEEDGRGVDLVLSDLSLAGDGTGLDVARAAHDRGVPVLFVTGNPPPQADQVAIGCLQKPYNGRQLKAALKAVEAVLAGNKTKPQDGLTLYPAAGAAADG